MTAYDKAWSAAVLPQHMAGVRQNLRITPQDMIDRGGDLTTFAENVAAVRSWTAEFPELYQSVIEVGQC